MNRREAERAVEAWRADPGRELAEFWNREQDMKPAIMHLVVRDTYSDGLRIMAVTTAKARRYWGRDVGTDTPMNAGAGQVVATFAGPDGAAKAAAVRPELARLTKALMEEYRAADRANAITRRVALAAYSAAVKAELEKVLQCHATP